MSQQSASESELEKMLGEPRLDHSSWMKALSEGTLLGLSCEECDYLTATPKAACPRCGSRSIAVVELPDTGTVYTKTTVEVAPAEHGTGYQIALVELDDAKLLVRIEDGNRVEIDDEVELAGTYEYGDDVAAAFRPVQN
jgi:uncharacterized OB-fold protein